mmetsp:Transcript_10172/g.17406  ORF Transcript_10172/g.17406 Transcript_10172/m.17406 type:complete len:311 (+) Transcript_10172:204-1136(+)
MPCTGVKASDEASPLDAPLEPAAERFRAFSESRVCCLALTRTLPVCCDLPSMPTPSMPSDVVSSSSPKRTRLESCRIAVMPYRSFILRSRRPPRRLPDDSGGTGSALAILGGGGSCSFVAFTSISSLKRWPIAPPSLSVYVSHRAASVHFPATSRATLTRSAGGVFCTTSQCWMKPACETTCVEDMPPSVRFFEPRICSTVEGSEASLFSPPAAPISFAAIAVPTSADTLGHTAPMRDSTKASMVCLLSASSRICSHDSLTAASASSGSGVPIVVDAVTVTTMMVADGRMPERSTSVSSISLPRRSTTRA